MTFSLTRRGFIRSVAGAVAACLGPAPAQAGAAGGKVSIYGHRGACALRPEHTLASYAKAIADGADFVEPDLVSTRDGVLVAAHDINITAVTDVAHRPEFAARRTSKSIDGIASSGWFADDFTLAEIKTLRRVEPMALVRPANTRYDGMFQIVTWEEIVDFVAAESATCGRMIGLVPELKNSTYFAKAGLALEDRFLRTLEEHEYTRRAPVEIQSLEIANLKYLRKRLGRRANIALMQLIDIDVERPGDVLAAGAAPSYAAMCTRDGLREVARYADIVAPCKRAIIATLPDGRLGAPSSFVFDAHQAGLRVVTWTMRPENRFLPPEFRSAEGDNARNEAGMLAEMRRFVQAGVDGFFCDDAGLARRAIES
jgi:glycerophosphoryl diester phosphodiesterase